ncbi:hypothetical protein NPA07_05180 [Mycoplasmopsis caviae]|uniref:Uncharacterized protein n=1 Tax=Mycoplasmopsis caviae TaxID=55603 RepID=A0A3P8KMJ8_9BACT|nr:hypothetical protein [Mycoplasmopsis caviae]UUD35167.1 hypothetical protein NPA07_05180 [Mycoplasmopsis caviae]VDR42028.1 Uncharacterised protein [Mycoplasmopsis caviae]
MRKSSVKNQQYEDYWQLTLEYSDINGRPYNYVLWIIINFIDEYVDPDKGLTTKQYQELQDRIQKVYPKKDAASTRKSINQFLKLGFIITNLKVIIH